MMKSKKELKEYLLKYYVDDEGYLDLSNLDFSDFNGDIFINNMKVKNNLFQDEQEVGEDLYQGYQKVGDNLYQDMQKVNGNLLDNKNIVTGKYVTQTLKDDEEYKFEEGHTFIVKKETEDEIIDPKQELKNYLLENCVNENGDLDLSGLDFSDFNGNVDTSDMKVKKDLIQSNQKVGGHLYQCCQKVGESMFDDHNEVRGFFLTQTRKDDEEYKIENGETYIVKKTKKLTKQEIEELLGYKIEIVG